MINGLKVAVIMPAYNAAATLRTTFNSLPRELVDDIILTDDYSDDGTASLSEELGIHTIVHTRNLGYGANQKTCYDAALARGADLVVMLHPDYQYSPKLVPAIAAMVASGDYDFALGSRMLGKGARAGGMPLYKYIANRMLTAFQNLMLGQKFSEYHTGFRCWSRKILLAIPYRNCSDDFVFDNQMLCQAIYLGGRGGEISCPTRYFEEASSISFRRSVIYGFGVLATSLQFRLQTLGLLRHRLFEADRAETPDRELQ